MCKGSSIAVTLLIDILKGISDRRISAVIIPLHTKENHLATFKATQFGLKQNKSNSQLYLHPVLLLNT